MTLDTIKARIAQLEQERAALIEQAQLQLARVGDGIGETMEQTLQERLRERLQQLQAERQQVAAQLQALLAQAEQARLRLSAYDGAIGELGELGRLIEVQAAPAMVAADTFDADDVARLKAAM